MSSRQVAIIAGQLGVTPDALADSHYDLEAHESDDGLLYGWIITFTSEPPEGITIPMNGTGPGAWAHITLLDEPDGPDA